MALQPTDQQFGGVGDVVTGYAFGPVGVAGDHRLEDGVVLVPDFIGGLTAQHLAHDTPQVAPVRRADFAYERVAGQAVEKEMEFHVRFGHLGDGAFLDGGASARQHRRAFFLGDIAGSGGHLAGGEAIQYGTHFHQIVHMVRVERRHDQAATRRVAQQATAA